MKTKSIILALVLGLAAMVAPNLAQAGYKSEMQSAYTRNTWYSDANKFHLDSGLVVIVEPRLKHHHRYVKQAAIIGVVLRLDYFGNTIDQNGNPVIIIDSDRHNDSTAQIIYMQGKTFILN